MRLASLLLVALVLASAVASVKTSSPPCFAAERPELRVVQYADMSPAHFAELLHAHAPFVVKGAPIKSGIWDHLFEIYESSRVELWNQTLGYWNIFEKEHNTRGDHLCPCAEMSSSIVTESTELSRRKQFQVVERAVRPYSRVDKEIVQPMLDTFHNQWMGNLSRINMFNTVFLSRGSTRGVMHYHNYEAFASFIMAGEGTTIYMAPPSCYGALNSTIRKAKATVVNAFGWNESSIDANLLVYAVQQGDMVHFPSGWFHRVDHRGEYLNVGHSFFVPAVLEQRLAAVAPHITSAADAEYYRMWTRRHPWWWYIAPTQYFYEMFRDGCKAQPHLSSAGLMLGTVVYALYRLRSRTTRA